MRIRQLPTQLINQIAAGEVIERPASVVKELLENSIDAGASAIEVDIEQGGKRRIRVRDNGVGIPRDELQLALSRHATSKIASLEDLERVSSMGFRGEALPSIASVSRLALSSRFHEADSGWAVQSDGSDTATDVQDLFYNTPARRKFLRAETTEFKHIDQVVRRIALGCFPVELKLQHNQRQTLRLAPATDRKSQERRVAGVCGDAFMEHAVHVEHAAAGLHLSGWVAMPTFSRSQADLQYFYVNNRMVRDKLVMSMRIRPSLKSVFATAAWCMIFSTAHCMRPWHRFARARNSRCPGRRSCWTGCRPRPGRAGYRRRQAWPSGYRTRCATMPRCIHGRSRSQRRCRQPWRMTTVFR
jgi:DNA mismatch repair protein MutL